MSKNSSIKNEIRLCRSFIEEQLARNKNEIWTRRDFELLSEKIFTKTGVLLSISTLRRIWNDDFKKIPHKSTLDALATFAGFTDWQNFSENNQHRPDLKNSSKNKLIILLVTSIILAGGLMLLKYLNYNKGITIVGPVVFDYHQKSDSTVPCIVVFDYNVRNINADSFFIIESSHDYTKKYLPVNEGQLTSSYYYPGIYQAFLMADDSVVKKLELNIVSHNWVAMITCENSPEVLPWYFYEENIIDNGSLSVSKRLLEKNNIPVSSDMKLVLSKTHTEKPLNYKDFILQTRVKLDSIDIESSCPEIYIGIQFENDFCYIPLIQNGGQDKLQIKYGNTILTSYDSDLSGLGCNLYTWHEVEIVSKNGSTSVFVDNNIVIALSDSLKMGNINGTSFNFDGIGSVDYLLLGNNKGDTTYYNSFEK